MLPDVLQDKAVQYVSGAMSAPEREGFEVLTEYLGELGEVVTGLRRVVAEIAVAELPAVATPPGELKARILDALAKRPAPRWAEGCVATDPAGNIEWVNAGFTAMCGYSLDELRGRKPGQVLQGPATDAATVARIRGALRDGRGCCETLANYHKDGTLYHAEVRIFPILGDDGRPLWFVARERRLD